jgi:hypothetical protein
MGRRFLVGFQDAILQIRRDISKVTFVYSDAEAFLLYSLVKATANLPGDIAEVGVFMGCSAKIICEADDKRTVHLFDTFEGLPAISGFDDSGLFKQGQYASSLDSVRDYLRQYRNVCFYKGLFPETAGPVGDKTFSFVHIDADLYGPTLESLKFFYPRMCRAGMILGHDYPASKGVVKAFDEFFRDKPEPVHGLHARMSSGQCLVVKGQGA